MSFQKKTLVIFVLIAIMIFPAMHTSFAAIATTVTLSSTPNPSAPGQPVVFTATVTANPNPAFGALTGSVTFMDGTTTLGIGTNTNLSTGGIQSTLSISTIGTGSHQIRAVYSGDTNFIGSTSIALQQTVNTATSTAAQATGQVSILGTCGLQFASGNPINYGSLVPDTTSDEQVLVLHNTGSVSGTITVNGGNWVDSANNNQMNVGNTKFSTSPNTPYGGKTALTTTDQMLGTVTTISDLPTYWQLQANLLRTSFAGSLTQTMTFTATC